MNLKKLGIAVILMFVLGLSTFAGETSTVACAPPEPGQTETMPCTSARMTPDDSVIPGETSAPPASNAVDILGVAEAAIGLLLIF